MQVIERRTAVMSSAQVLILAFVTACAAAATAIGAFPLQLSIVTIFLFAGPHNFMEFRYFLARMPVRWGRSRAYYSAAIGGVVVLTAAYLALYFANDGWLWDADRWLMLTAVWNTAFVVWVGWLFYLRGRQRPRSDWSWAFPVAFLVAAAAWLVPQYWSLALVYLHPLVALWFLERQIRRTKPEWLRAYHFCLASIPLFLLVLWSLLAGTSHLPEDTRLFWRISQHAGSQILPAISSHLLVATHVFLETVHYAVWILLIPLIDRRAVPWKIDEIPLFARRDGFPRLTAALLVVSLVATAALYFGFAADYMNVRDIYFAFAIGHVLAEFPFLIKML